MTPEREFADFVMQEAKRRGLSCFVLVANDQTERFSYRMEVVTGNPAVAATLSGIQQTLAQVCRPTS